MSKRMCFVVTQASLALVLGATLTIKGMILDAGPAKKGYPRGYEVYVSKDGKTWGQPILAGVDEKTPTKLEFGAAVTTRHVKIVQTGFDEKAAWAIRDIQMQY